MRSTRSTTGWLSRRKLSFWCGALSGKQHCGAPETEPRSLLLPSGRPTKDDSVPPRVLADGAQTFRMETVRLFELCWPSASVTVSVTV